MYYHAPVLLKECMDMLQIQPGKLYVDATLGGGGHSQEILNRGGRVLGIDRDQDAIAASSERFKQFGGMFTAVKSNYAQLQGVLRGNGIGAVAGIIADLGVSSYQLDSVERGFSYMREAPLDMRMDQESALSASEVVNTYSQEELTRVIREYGEESWASRIAEFIVRERERKQICTTDELVEIIKSAIPASARRTGPHPAKRTFQAIRIEVNQELELLPQAIGDMVGCLEGGGRLVVLTFHSLEDRIVKRAFASLEKPCTCPPKAPLCICGKKPSVTIVTKKPVEAGQDELFENPRSRSAKLRCAQKRST